MKIPQQPVTKTESYSITDDESNLVLNEVETLLAGDNKLRPQQAIDKQILAFSHRALKTHQTDKIVKEVLTNELQFAGSLSTKQWWRRLALPSFVAGSFTLTIFAFQSLWQPLLDGSQTYNNSDLSTSINEEQKIEQPLVEFSVEGKDQISSYSKKSVSKLNRDDSAKQALMDLEENQKMPVADLRLADGNSDNGIMSKDKGVGKGFISAQAKVESEKSSVNLERQNIYTGSELSKSEYPEKEIWVQKIVKLFDESQNTQAAEQLKAFKKAYPNYPIDDKIKAYHQ